MGEELRRRRLPVNIAMLILPIYEREYRDLCDSWASLERKAQLAGGAAGALLTGGLAVLSNDRLDLPSQVILAVPVVGLLVYVALVYSLRALWVSSETLPPPGEDVREMAWQLMNTSVTELQTSFEVEYFHLQIVQWDTACRDLHKSITQKARLVTAAQRWLLVTATGFLLLMIGMGWMR